MIVQRILNFVARVIAGRRRFDHLFDEGDALDWLDFFSSQLFRYQSLSQLHKIIRTGKPQCIAGQMRTNHDSCAQVHSTRQGHLLQLPTIHSEAGRRRFLYRAHSLFNKMPISVRDLKGAQLREQLKAYSCYLILTAFSCSFPFLLSEFCLSGRPSKYPNGRG